MAVGEAFFSAFWVGKPAVGVGVSGDLIMSCISSRLRSIDIVGIFDMDAVTVDESDTVSETSTFYL